MSHGLWVAFHTRWKEIDREWLGAGHTDPDVLSAAMSGIRAARSDLRAQVRAIARSFGGTYLLAL